MNTMLNYLIEVNLGLLFFYLLYWVLLRNENQFTVKRAYLLGSLLASFLFPLFRIPNDGAQLIPTLSNSPAANWLPEITILADTASVPSTTSFTIWQWIPYFYFAGFALFLLLFIVRLTLLVRLFKSSKKYYWKNYLVAESENTHGSFSFFQFIFLGKALDLSDHEKQEILIHEEVHIQKMHSFDIVVVNLLGIIFWFNPAIQWYRRSFVQIHEFEADARSVESRDVNAYCNLLAKVALQSNGYPLANHFTNSLTLKRIMMMKTVQKKIKQWKLVTVSLAIAAIFFVVACQDQVMQDIQAITDNSTSAVMLPPKVEAELERLKSANPKSEYIVLEMNEDGKKKMEELDKNEEFNKSLISMSVIKDADQSFVILQKGDKTNMLSEMTAKDGEIFTIVEESASPEGGFPALYEYITANLKYPEEAKMKGVEGKVFVEFTVNKDGTLQDIHTTKGIGAGCDSEAVRVMNGSPKWIPASQRGKTVRQRMVLPITFKLNANSAASISLGEVASKDLEFTPIVDMKTENGMMVLSGTVKDSEGAPLPGTNVVIAGTTTGTVTSLDGSFHLQSPVTAGKLVFSFVGYQTKEVKF
jgi:TonB family protein